MKTAVIVDNDEKHFINCKNMLSDVGNELQLSRHKKKQKAQHEMCDKI